MRGLFGVISVKLPKNLAAAAGEARQPRIPAAPDKEGSSDHWNRLMYGSNLNFCIRNANSAPGPFSWMRLLAHTCSRGELDGKQE